MTDFCAKLAELSQTADVTMLDALLQTTRYENDEHAEQILHDIINKDFIPPTDVMQDLARYFGIGIDMFFKSEHESTDAKKIYIAGPITGRPNFMSQFDKAHTYLEAAGYQVFNPARVSSQLPSAVMSRQHFMDLGLCLLGMCNAIALLPDWQTATGAQMEYAYAVANRMKVITLTQKQLDNI